MPLVKEKSNTSDIQTAAEGTTESRETQSTCHPKSFRKTARYSISTFPKSLFQ
jgi:hypothetical protein